MKLSHKLWLAVSFPLLALIFVSYKNYRQAVATDLASLRRQQKALPIIHDLRTILEDVQQDRGQIAQAIKHLQVSPTLIKDHATHIRQVSDKVSAEIAQSGSRTAQTGWKKTQSQIEATFSGLNSSKLGGFETYTKIAEGILNEVDIVASEAQFSAGGDRAVLLRRLLADLVPHLIEEISVVQGLTSFNLFIDQTTNDDISKISGYMSLSRYRYGAAMQALASLDKANPELVQSILPNKMAFQNAFESFSTSIDRYLKGNAKETDQDVLKLGEEAQEKAYAIFDQIFQKVSTEVASNVESHQSDIRDSLIIGGFGILLCTIFLLHVISTFVRSVTDLLDITERIAAGGRDIEIEQTDRLDEMGTLANAIERMYRAICRSEAELHKGAERKQFLADLDKKLQADSSLSGLANDYLAALADRLRTALGVVYMLGDGGSMLAPIAGYAPGIDLTNEATMPAKQGLVGEALKTGRLLRIDGIATTNTVPLKTGTLAVVPESVVVAPISFENEALGAIEVGFLQAPDEGTMHLLQQTLDVLSVRFAAAKSRATLEELYEHTKEQAQELTERQSELEAANRDLELKTSELEQQQIELEMVNQKLEEQRKDLEVKNTSIQTAHQEIQRAKEEVDLKASELEAASRYKSEFLANMSHELRSPLNSVLVFSEILAKNEHATLSRKEVEFAHTIHASGTDLLNLIEDILDLSKVEAGRLELRPERFDLNELIGGIDAGFRAQVEQKGLELVIDIADDVPTFWHTDRQRVTQIVRNFLSNAIKFTDRGAITLRVRRPQAVHASAATTTEGLAQISVIDTGIGIRQEDQVKLFKAFQQIDSGPNRRYSGTGLGLSISLKLAQLLGGRVEMTSEPGSGSTFSAILPIAHEAEPVAAAYAESEAMAAAPTPLLADIVPFPTGGLRAPPPAAIADDRLGITPEDKSILIIEDDPAFAQHVVDCCHARGFKCLVATTGERGLDDAATFLPGGIILDIALPGMSGLAALDHLKRDPRTKRIPVHVVSAADYRIEVERHEHVGFLRKPVSLAQLKSVLDGLEGQASGTQRRVLVVAQPSAERENVIQMIERQSALPRPADSGSAALDLLGTESFNCIVMDLHLPDASGLEVLQKIKEQPESGVPVIVLAEHELTKAEEQDIMRYAGSIIVKGEKAAERLIDEVNLFLHSVGPQLPSGVRKLSGSPPGPHALAGRQVLLVDDDMRNLFAIMSILEAEGMVVHTANDGREALTLLDTHADIALVLMDMMMPEMDGYEATREIRKIERLKKLPVIALTARAMKGEREQCLAAGADDYMSKPLKVDQLLALIRLWLA